MPFLQNMATVFFDEKREAGISFPFKQNEQKNIMQFICTVCRAFRFVPRQIETFFRIFSQFMAITKTDKIVQKTWIEATITLIAIFIDNRALYTQIGNASVPPKELHDYLKALDYSFPPYNHNEHYTILTAMAFCLRDEQDEESNEIADICGQYYNLNLNTQATKEEKRKDIIRKLNGTLDRWGHLGEQSAFQKIYNLMEEWRSFIE